MKKTKANFKTPRRPATTETLLIQPDGQVLANNLTPAMAEVLAALNPGDEAMQIRSGKTNRNNGSFIGEKNQLEPRPSCHEPRTSHP